MTIANIESATLIYELVRNSVAFMIMWHKNNNHLILSIFSFFCINIVKDNCFRFLFAF